MLFLLKTSRQFLLLALTLSTIAALSLNVNAQSDKNSAEHTQILIKRGFVPAPNGQIHYRIAEPEIKTGNPPLVMFHPGPYSSAYYLGFMKLMANDRAVIALDTPGYGDSDAPSKLQTIKGYALALNSALDELGYEDATIDLFGFHTGTLIAVEVGIMRPNTVRRIVLAGVPFFVGEEQEIAYKENAVAPKMELDGSHLDAKWAFSTSPMEFGLSLEMAQKSFNDGVQCFPKCWWGYHAVFTYDGVQRFAKVKQRSLLISEPASLDKETRDAIKHFPNVEHVHIEDFPRGGFKIVPELMVNATRAFLDK